MRHPRKGERMRECPAKTCSQWEPCVHSDEQPTPTPIEKATEGPWTVEYDGPSLPIICTHTPRFEIVAHVKTNDADARLIVRAVNVHEDLVRVARLMLSDVDSTTGERMPEDYIGLAREVIARLDGEK